MLGALGLLGLLLAVGFGGAAPSPRPAPMGVRRTQVGWLTSVIPKASWSSGERPTARVVTGPRTATAVADAGLLGGGRGWADNGLALYFTADGGVRWWTATPPDVRAYDVVVRVFGVSAPNPTDVWLGASVYPTGANRRRCMVPGGAGSWTTIIDASTDGGHTWSEHTLPGCVGLGYVAMSVVSPTIGWVLGDVGVGAHRRRLFETVDGGRQWTLTGSPPFVGWLQFTDPTHGWGEPRKQFPNDGTVAMPVQILYRTADGGRRWRPVVLPRPAGVTGAAVYGTPQVFSARAIEVPVLYGDTRHAPEPVFVYASTDGGATWRWSRAPASVSGDPYQQGVFAVPFAAASPTRWIIRAGRRLLVTADGGAHWRVLPSLGPFTVLSLDFARPGLGWAIAVDRACRGGQCGPILLASRDGGRRWTVLSPPDPAGRVAVPVPG